jgi:hypothetical protein
MIADDVGVLLEDLDRDDLAEREAPYASSSTERVEATTHTCPCRESPSANIVLGGEERRETRTTVDLVVRLTAVIANQTTSFMPTSFASSMLTYTGRGVELVVVRDGPDALPRRSCPRQDVTTVADENGPSELLVEHDHASRP